MLTATSFMIKGKKSNIWELNILWDIYRMEYHAVTDNHIYGSPLVVWKNAYNEIKFTDAVYPG